MSVLSQAISSASHSHKLEFMVKSTEELNAVMEELKACDSGTTLEQSVTRSCICDIVQGCVYELELNILTLIKACVSLQACDTTVKQFQNIE